MPNIALEFFAKIYAFYSSDYETKAVLFGSFIIVNRIKK